jgi:F-type H+-transporting ATPase subunit delta
VPPPAKVVCFINGFERWPPPAWSPKIPEERLAVVASESPILTGLAGRYATALYELADEAKALDQVAADLASLKAAFAGNADLQRLAASPLVPRAQQAKAVLALLGKMGVGDLTRRFVGTVARNRRLFQLPKIIDAYAALLAAHRGEVTATVTAAKPLSAPQTEQVTAALRAAVGRKVAVAVDVDPKLLGGLKVKVGSRLIDASLSTKLQRLQLAMKGL